MISVEDYIRMQVVAFEANERRENRERRPGRGKEGGLFYGPYLLISREKGAGGNTVARLLGRRLGWLVFEREIVDEIAKKAHLRRELIESLDERDRKTVRDAIGQWLKPKEIDASSYLGYLRQVVLTLGHQGDVVIVGHGARFMLPPQFGLSVRMVAPIETRIRRIADKTRLSLDDARVEVERSDRERVKLVSRDIGQELTDPLNHDLMINTAAISAAAAAEVIITALQEKLSIRPAQGSGKR